MEKITYKLKDYPETPQGYGQMYPPTESDIFEKMLELPKNCRYIKHFMRSEWIRDYDEEEFYSPKFDKELKIPYGTTTYYLDVYVEKSKPKVIHIEREYEDQRAYWPDPDCPCCQEKGIV